MNNKTLQNLAKSYRFQLLYNKSKEIASIHIFNNTSDFTVIQILFLSYLELYSKLYQALRDKEPFLSEDVINDDLRVEAYLLLKDKEKNNSKSTTGSSSDGAVIFRRPKE